jgi:hypothetical protein
MTQALYAHMNNKRKINKINKNHAGDIVSEHKTSIIFFKKSFI